MIKILCYGDSNTWGCKPFTGLPLDGERFPRDKRWPGVLEKEFKGNCEVFEEGLNGRTTVWDDPIEGPNGAKNGKKYLPPCLGTHKPLDLIVILLGTNDLKKRFSLSAFDIAEGAGALVDIVKKSDSGRDGAPPRALLLAPPPVYSLSSFFKDMFEGAQKKSKEFSGQYRRVANDRECHFLDTSDYISVTSSDGIHLDEGDHEALGKAVASKIEKLEF